MCYCVLPCSIHRTLLIGEGNFSFAHSLYDHFVSTHPTRPSSSESSYIPPIHLVATCYDDETTLHTKYADAVQHITALQAAGVTVYSSVDATALDKDPRFPPYVNERKKYKKVIETKNSKKKKTKSSLSLSSSSYTRTRFHRILFNFPHTGCGIKDTEENNETNRALIRGFLQR